MKVWVVFLAMLISGVSLASEDIKFHEAGDNFYVVEVNSTKYLGEKKGLEIIKQEGMKKCGEMPANFGKYRFQGSENLGGDKKVKESFRIVQELFCGELPEIAQEIVKPLSDKEKAEFEDQAQKSADLYLNYLIKSDFENAYALVSNVTKESKTYSDWLETRKHLTATTGDLLRSDIWGVTTYLNPPSSERKGVFIATDFEREYSDSVIYCGYLVWFLESGELRVIREDIGHINLKEFQERAEELIKVKGKFRCKPPVGQNKQHK